MTGTLIFILFLMNILLALALLLLYLRQNKLLEIEKRQKLVLDESEQLMATLLEEIKEENEKLLSRMNDRGEKEKTENAMVEEKSLLPMEDELKDLQSFDPKKPPVTSQTNESNESDEGAVPLSLREQAKVLAEQGMTVTEIARKLNKGKTEIELLLKFQ